MAKDIIACSPDAVQSTKRAVLLAMQNGSVDMAAIAGVWSPESKRTYTGQNIKVSFLFLQLNERFFFVPVIHFLPLDLSHVCGMNTSFFHFLPLPLRCFYSMLRWIRHRTIV